MRLRKVADLKISNVTISFLYSASDLRFDGQTKMVYISRLLFSIEAKYSVTLFHKICFPTAQSFPSKMFSVHRSGVFSPSVQINRGV